MQSFKLKFLGVTILQGVKFPIFLLIFEWALQRCSATALPVTSAGTQAKCNQQQGLVRANKLPNTSGAKRLQTTAPGLHPGKHLPDGAT